MSGHLTPGKRSYLGPLLLTGMSFAFFGPVLFTGRVFMLGDLCFFFYPGYVFFSETLRSGALPLWNHYTGCGEPFLASLEWGVLYPPHLLYLALPTSTAVVLLATLHVLLAGIGTYGLARAWGCSAVASLYAGILYAFSSYTITKIEFPSELGSAAWFPVVFFCFVRWTQRPDRRALVALTAAISMQFLSGFPETLIFSLGAIFAYGLYIGLRDWWSGRRWTAIFSPAFGLALGGLLAVLVCMAQLLPTWEALELSPRGQVVDPRLHTNSIPPMAVFSLLVPSVYGIKLRGSPGSYWCPTSFDYSVTTFYIGVIPIVLLIAAVIHWALRVREPRPQTISPDSLDRAPVGYLIVVALVFFFYAMGCHTPFYGLCWKILPPIRHFTCPPKCLLCVVLPLSCLTAIALDSLGRTTGAHEDDRFLWRTRIDRWATAILFAAIAVIAIMCIVDNGRQGVMLLRRFFNLDAVPPRFAHLIPWSIIAHDASKLALLGLAGSMLLFAYRYRPSLRTLAAWSFVALSFADLWVTNAYLMWPGSHKILDHPSPYAKQLRSEGLPTRFLSFEHVWESETRKMIQGLPTPTSIEELPDSAIKGSHWKQAYRAITRLGRNTLHSAWPLVDKAFKLHSSNVFVPYRSARVIHLATTVDVPTVAKARLLSMLNCDRSLLLPDDLIDLFERGSVGPTRVGKLGLALPRAYVVGGVEILDDEGAVLRAMAAKPFAPLEVALVDRAEAADGSLQDLHPGPVDHEVKRLEYKPNRVDIEVDSHHAGLLVVSDVYYPGWSATVNGEPARLYRVNYGFRAVRITAGSNAVTMSYWPATLSIGIGVSLTAMVVLLMLALGRGKAPA